MNKYSFQINIYRKMMLKIDFEKSELKQYTSHKNINDTKKLFDMRTIFHMLNIIDEC